MLQSKKLRANATVTLGGVTMWGTEQAFENEHMEKGRESGSQCEIEGHGRNQKPLYNTR